MDKHKCNCNNISGLGSKVFTRDVIFHILLIVFKT